MHQDRREDGLKHQAYTLVFYLYKLSHAWFSCDHLHDNGFLAEYAPLCTREAHCGLGSLKLFFHFLDLADAAYTVFFIAGLFEALVPTAQFFSFLEDSSSVQLE